MLEPFEEGPARKKWQLNDAPMPLKGDCRDKEIIYKLTIDKIDSKN